MPQRKNNPGLIGRYLAWAAALACLAGLVSGCFISPDRAAPGSGDAMFIPPTIAPTARPTNTPPLPAGEATRAAACTDILSYQNDVTFPDGTSVTPGSAIDKRWSVKNSGTCGWDSRYKIRWIGGSKLGAENDLPLVAAAAGSTAEIRIDLTAPAAPGKYRSAWQAVNPQGDPFGDAFYIEFIVQPSQ
jgi:hypothetical protein